MLSNQIRRRLLLSKTRYRPWIGQMGDLKLIAGLSKGQAKWAKWAAWGIAAISQVD